MPDEQGEVAALLHEAGETHRRVYRIADGEDPDWASWHAWLIHLSELPKILGGAPVRSELIYVLVKLDRDYTAHKPSAPWEPYYASELLEHFRAGS
jgi:hypothetical protein